MNDPRKPGHCPDKDIWGFSSKYFRNMVKFINGFKEPCVDIGKYNSKIKYISEQCHVNIKQIEVEDFNFDEFPSDLHGKCKTIICFEMLEHMQNPLFFMKQMKSILSEDGSIFLSMPGRPEILRTKYHFVELTPKRFLKWILIPMDMQIIRYKKLRIVRKAWWFYFKGFRPLLRIYYDFTWIYEIKHK